MDKSFWHSKWAENNIAFHEREANPLLTRHFKELFPANIRRVFLPLCGKTRDAHWLRHNGYQVVGVELSAMAVDQLFEELSLAPEKATCGDVRRYSAKDIDIW
jgi:thiopurine S-methyltransferase